MSVSTMRTGSFTGRVLNIARLIYLVLLACSSIPEIYASSASTIVSDSSSLAAAIKDPDVLEIVISPEQFEVSYAIP